MTKKIAIHQKHLRTQVNLIQYFGLFYLLFRNHAYFTYMA